DHEFPAHQKVCRQVYQTLGASVFQTITPTCPHVLDACAAGMDVINRSLNSIGATGYIRLANEILDRFRLR
ncbi:MAG: ParA family protein, partial [Deltaproteobacteria bacterium]